MYINKNFNFKNIWAFSWFHIVWISLWSTIVPLLYFFFDLNWLVIPWIPISIIATAVAFYIGFKNNSSYDRLWEARKIWGAIVNYSRMWGTTVKHFITEQFSKENITSAELNRWHQRLIYRHIAYLYTLRNQLLIPTPWEHINQSKYVRKLTEQRLSTRGVGLYEEDNVLHEKLERYLNKDEMEKVVNYQNTATHLIDRQSQDLKQLRSMNLIDDFRHMELQKLNNEFYTHQGKCERIKKFPFPRQYGGMSFIFVAIFIFLLPFGIVGQFSTMGEYGIWYSIPFTIIVSWVYLMMELVGDYSENPFEGLGNDIPMLSLCRVIEIDLLELLDEENVPPKIEAKNGILM